MAYYSRPVTFKDFYKPGKIAISFEVFPPKTIEGINSLFSELTQIKKLNPAFISVTYGAMGSTHDLTRDLAIKIQKELGLTTAFHFTCVGSTRESIKEYVEHLKKEGFNLVVALRGDPPQGVGKFIPPSNGFAYANELVGYLKKINGFSIAVAGYPEGHIEASNKEVDLQNLKRKVDAGADIVITQLFFDNQKFFDFVNRARKIGISIPIIPGILPILNVKQVERLASLCGAKIPKLLHQKLLKCGDNTDAMREIGIEHATTQCVELIKSKVPGMHFYMLNKAHSVKEIITNLKK